jgi:hypothetical protein
VVTSDHSHMSRYTATFRCTEVIIRVPFVTAAERWWNSGGRTSAPPHP